MWSRRKYTIHTVAANLALVETCSYIRDVSVKHARYVFRTQQYVRMSHLDLKEICIYIVLMYLIHTMLVDNNKVLKKC